MISTYQSAIPGNQDKDGRRSSGGCCEDLPRDIDIIRAPQNDERNSRIAKVTFLRGEGFMVCSSDLNIRCADDRCMNMKYERRREGKNFADKYL
eukprot:1393351-Amorphochlora_amoeboformis.AAC.1